MLVKNNHLLPSFPILLSPSKAKYGLTARTKPALIPSRARLGVSQLSGRAVRGQPAPAYSQEHGEGLLLTAGWAPKF